MIEKLRIINDKLIILNKNNKDNLKKYELIKKLLSDPDCFKKMNIESAYALLRDLEIKEKDLSSIYVELI